MVIWKWLLTKRGSLILSMPADTKVLSVGVQQDSIYVWGIVPDPTAPLVTREFRVLWTGEEFVGNLERSNLLGTVQLSNGLVYHVFML